MRQSVNILGISAFYHDSAACLVQDGKIISAAQEERFTRKKHDASFPTSAINYCLKNSGLTSAELDFVAFYEKPFLKFERILDTYMTYAPFGIKSFLKAIPLWIKQKLWMKELIREKLNYDGKIIFPEHHESHAASAFFPSPFQEAAILTMDGVGEWTTSSLGTGSGNIAITLAHELQGVSITGIDSSKETLETAKKNAAKLMTTHSIHFRCQDASDAVRKETKPFIIVSNPPYIPLGSTLDSDVVDYEPAPALFAGTDGLDVITGILLAAKENPLCRAIIFECRSDQVDAIDEILSDGKLST